MSEPVSHETGCFKDAVAQQIEQKRAGKRRLVFHGGKLCSKCYCRPPRAGQRYCAECQNEAAKASYHRKQKRLAILDGLEEQLKMSKGNEHEQRDRQTAASPDEGEPPRHS